MTGWHPFLSLNGYVTRVPVAGVTCSREKTSTWNSHASTHSCLGYPFDRILLLFLSFFFLPSISRLYPFHHCHNKLLLVVLFLSRSLNLVSFSSYSLQPRVSLLLDIYPKVVSSCQDSSVAINVTLFLLFDFLVFHIYKGLFTFFYRLQLHSPLTSIVAFFVFCFSTRFFFYFVRSFFYFVIRARKYISRNMSPISYDVFNFTFKVFPLPGSSHSPFNFPDFRHFEKLSILESYFRHLCNSPFRFLCRLLSCLSHIYVSLILLVPLSLYRFSKIQISKFLIIVSTRSLEKSPMTSNDRSI